MRNSDKIKIQHLFQMHFHSKTYDSSEELWLAVIKDYLTWQGFEVVAKPVEEQVEPTITQEQHGSQGWLEKFNTRSKKLE